MIVIRKLFSDKFLPRETVLLKPEKKCMPEDTIDWIIVVDEYCNIPLKKKKSCQSLFCGDNTCKPIQY